MAQEAFKVSVWECDSRQTNTSTTHDRTRSFWRRRASLICQEWYILQLTAQQLVGCMYHEVKQGFDPVAWRLLRTKTAGTKSIAADGDLWRIIPRSLTNHQPGLVYVSCKARMKANCSSRMVGSRQARRRRIGENANAIIEVLVHVFASRRTNGPTFIQRSCERHTCTPEEKKKKSVWA